MSKACENVDHALGQARLLGEKRQRERGQRREFRGLKDHSIAHRDGRCDLPARREDGRVPGRNLEHDAHRFATCVVEVA